MPRTLISNYTHLFLLPRTLYLFQEQEIRIIVKDIENASKAAGQALTIIHTSLTDVSVGCQEARQQFALCREGFQKLAGIISEDRSYYRYHDHWTYTMQNLVSLVALTIFLEIGTLVSRETVAEILGR